MPVGVNIPATRTIRSASEIAVLGATLEDSIPEHMRCANPRNGFPTTAQVSLPEACSIDLSLSLNLLEDRR
jgi:hypothetical protein